MKKYIITTILLCVFILQGISKEKVYLSTDKEYYLSGENIWCSVYCMDENGFSPISAVAYLDFYNNEGLATTFKLPLVEGRGCAKFEIPFSFKTGNYSIIAYTRADGGNSIGEYRGKIVSIFNTLTNERVAGGVEVCEGIEPSNFNISKHGKLALERLTDTESGLLSLKLKNQSSEKMSLNLSVYNNGDLERLIGERAYDKSLLLDRTGDFESTGVFEYEGEVLSYRVSSRDGLADVAGKRVYLSVVGGEEVYTATTDSNGYLTFYTSNIYGNREIVLDIEAEGNFAVEPVVSQYDHKVSQIPILKISYELNNALNDRGISMQVSKRFEADTLYEIFEKRSYPLLEDRDAIRYHLDDYTRFPSMEEVIREYVKGLRIRKVSGVTEIQILSVGDFNSPDQIMDKAFVMLDGVPVRDHSLIANFDPLLVEDLLLYPRQYLIGGVSYNGIAHFKTYKGNMGGLKQGANVSVLNHKGVAYPLALLGAKIHANERYPNYNRTIYWNPIITLEPGETYEFDCSLPEYEGDFKIVVEGIDSQGNSLYLKEDLKR